MVKDIVVVLMAVDGDERGGVSSQSRMSVNERRCGVSRVVVSRGICQRKLGSIYQISRSTSLIYHPILKNLNRNCHVL